MIEKENALQGLFPANPARETLQQGFDTIRQGPGTNKLVFAKPTKKNTIVDTITGAATTTKGDVVLKMNNYSKLSGPKTSTYQLLMVLNAKLTSEGMKGPRVSMSLADYMSARGLKNRKETKAQVQKDLEVLMNTTLSWEERRRGKIETFRAVNLADSASISRNGDISFTFSSTFFEILKSYPIARISSQLPKVNSHKNPNAFAFLYKINLHKAMNYNKANADVIAVSTLLDVASTIPSFDEVMQGNRNLTERIIEPFERDLNALADTFTWEYCHRNHAPLMQAELETFDFSTFKELLIHVIWNNYPERASLPQQGENQTKGRKGKAPASKKKP